MASGYCTEQHNSENSLAVQTQAPLLTGPEWLPTPSLLPVHRAGLYPTQAVSGHQLERIQAETGSSFLSQHLHSQVHSKAPQLQAARQSASDPSTPMNKKPLPTTYPQRQNTVVTTNANKLPRATQLKWSLFSWLLTRCPSNSFSLSQMQPFSKY